MPGTWTSFCFTKTLGNSRQNCLAGSWRLGRNAAGAFLVSARLRHTVICSKNAFSRPKKSPPSREYPVTLSPDRCRSSRRDCSVSSSAWLSGGAISVRSRLRGASSSQQGRGSPQGRPSSRARTRFSSRVSKRFAPVAQIRPIFPSHPAPGEGRFLPFGFAEVSS